jgi:hypothetical protein
MSDGHAAHGHGHSSHGHSAHGHGGSHGHGGHDAHGAPHSNRRLVMHAPLAGLVVLLGVALFVIKLGQEQGGREGHGNLLLSSYSTAKAYTLSGVTVREVRHATIDVTPQRPVSLVYLVLDSGQHFMAMDMAPLSGLGVSNAVVALSAQAYKVAEGLQPGKVDLQVTGAPPTPLILAGMAPLVIGITPR